MLKRSLPTLFLGLLAAMLLSACGDKVAFRLCDQYGAPLHHGALDLGSGAVQVDAGSVRYSGTLVDGALASPSYARTLKGELRGSDGSALRCEVNVEKSGAGQGNCTGSAAYRVKLRDLPHM